MIIITLYFDNNEFTKIKYGGTYEQASRFFLGKDVSFEGKTLKVIGIDLG